ncbi:MAG: PAS domain S-box protein [Spirochaetia bacterium]
MDSTRSSADGAFQAVLDHMRECFTLLEIVRDDSGAGVDLRVLAANQAFAALIGTGTREVLGRTVRELDQGFDAAIMARLGEVTDDGPSLDFEYRAAPSGVLLRFRAFGISPGNVALIFEDSVSGAETDTALQESEERYRLLFSSINDMILVHPIRGDGSPDMFVEVNDVASERLGYTREELLRMSPREIDAPEGLRMIPAAMARLSSEGHAVWEGMHQRKDGRTMPVEISNRLFSMGGKPMVLATIRDITERRRAEEALRESEERYRQLVELSPDAVLVHRHGAVAFANSSALALFGAAEPTALLGREVMDLVHPDFREIVRDRSLRIQRDGEMVPREEQKCLRLDGSAFDVEVSSAPINYAGARSSLTIIRDVTDRTRAQEALRRRVEEMAALQATLLEITTPHDLSRLLELIVERAVHLLHADGGGLYLCDPTRQLVRCVVSSRTAADYVGTTLRYGEGAAGLVAQTGTAFVVEDYSAWPGRAGSFQTTKPFRALASAPLVWQGQVTGVIHVLRYQEGNSFSPNDLELLSVFANHAAIAAENARLRDGLEKELGQRNRLEAEREAATQRLEFVVSATRTWFDIVDADYNVQYIDPARAKLFGSFGGRKCYEYFRGRTSPCGDCAMIRALATRRVVVAEQTNPVVETRSTQVTATPYQTESGAWMVAEVSVDISERKQAEEERLEMERRMLSAEKLEGMGILAGGIAHNFNNFLSIMLGNAELLRDILPRDSDSAALAQEIVKAGYRSRDLIGQLLAMGRRRVLELRPLDLNEVIRECGAMLRKALRENIAIDYQLSDSPSPVTADPGRIEEILLNLALNAQDAIPREGRLTIATSEVFVEGPADQSEKTPRGRCVLLTVSDTGAGMNPETLTKIFDPFFTTKEPGKGTGLGLATVYGIVKQHKGTIEADSRPAEGTRFRIYLPRTEDSPGEPPAAETPPPIGGTETVLLVDDEEPVRRLLSRHLRSLGYNVLEAADGSSALRVFEEHAGVVDMLLTDVVMPQMNGRVLYDGICARAPAMKVLFMSGYGQDVVSSHIAQGAGMPLITKPFTRLALASRVREILDRPCR